MPHVIINGINFGKSIWEIVNLSISITNSNTNSLTLNVRSKPMQNSSHLNVEKSILGHCNFEGISVKMTNCSFTGGHYTDSLLTISDSSVTFEKTNLSNINYTQSLVVATSSSLTLRDSDFFNNNLIPSVFQQLSLIRITQKCTLVVDMCHFWGNSGSIIRSVGSFIRVKNSVFTKNTGFVHCVLTGYGNTQISVDNSTFTDNSAGAGIAILLETGQLHITNSYFSENYANSYGGAIFAYDNSTVIVSHTVFDSNRADKEGGAMWLSNLNRFICSDCHFFNNSAKGNTDIHYFIPVSSGAIFIHNSHNVKLSMITFNSNKGSAIMFINCTNSHVTDSQFQNNSTPLDGGAVNAFKSETIFRNVSFTENNAEGNGGSVYFLSSSSLNFSGCLFSKNTASYHLVPKLQTNNIQQYFLFQFS